MKRFDYLKQSLKIGNYSKLAWWMTAFGIVEEPADSWKADPYEGRIVREPWGFSVVIGGQLVKIDDANPKQPLFHMLEEVQIDRDWIVNCKGPTTTLVGALLANQILIVDNFGAKIDYIPENISIKAIETKILQLKADYVPGKEKDPTKIYPDDYLNMAKGVEFLKQTPTLSVYSLTERNILPPEGLKAKKKELLEKYAGKLDDPVQLAAFEAELLAFDTEYMKGDPSFGKLVSGKIHKNARRKLFLSSGAEGGLKGAMVPVTESLLEGVELTPEKFAAQVNGARAGSYFRGVDTIKGGVSGSISIRVFSTFEVKEGDCGSMTGVERIYTKPNLSNLVGRMIIGSTKRIENISEAGNYLGKLIRVRSPAFCLEKGERFCSACAGPSLSAYKKGMIIPATNMTSAIMAASMAAMHKNTTTTAKFALDKVIS